MTRDMFGINSEGFYIVKFYHSSWLRDAIFATYLSNDKSKMMVEIFLLFNKDRFDEIITSVSLPAPDIESLLVDIINGILQGRKDQLEDQSAHLSKQIQKYEVKHLREDLTRSSNNKYDIARLAKFHKNSLKQIARDITKCQNLKEDILRMIVD